MGREREHIGLMGEVYLRKREEWLMEVMTDKRGSVQQRLAFEEDSLTRGKEWRRRVGRPRLQWLTQTRERIWERLQDRKEEGGEGRVVYNHKNGGRANAFYEEAIRRREEKVGRRGVAH